MEEKGQEDGDKNPTDEKSRCNIQMMVPVRCFTCGSVIGDKWEEYKRRVKNGEDAKKVLDEMGIKRYCCRRMLLSCIDIIDEVLEYDVTQKS